MIFNACGHVQVVGVGGCVDAKVVAFSVALRVAGDGEAVPNFHAECAQTSAGMQVNLKGTIYPNWTKMSICFPVCVWSARVLGKKSKATLLAL